MSKGSYLGYHCTGVFTVEIWTFLCYCSSLLLVLHPPLSHLHHIAVIEGGYESDEEDESEEDDWAEVVSDDDMSSSMLARWIQAEEHSTQPKKHPKSSHTGGSSRARGS